MQKVSVIVPIYKAEEWIAECLASIQAQRYPNVEWILENDPQGSGAWAARNRGLAKATGDYVTFCDADDFMATDAIEKMVAAMDGVDMVVGSFRKFGTFEEIITHPTALLTDADVADYVMGNLKSPRHNQMLSGCWAKLYKRDKVSKFPPLTTAEDMAFNFDYLMKCDRVRFLSDVVYHNRKRPGSLSTTFKKNEKPGLFGFLSGLEYVRRFLEIHYKTAVVSAAIDNSKVYHSMLYFMRICNQTGLPMRETLLKLYS